MSEDIQAWHEEHGFWYTKFKRAAIRWNIAYENKNPDEMEVASKQMRLYRNRMDAVMPESFKEQIRKEKEAERLAAINE